MGDELARSERLDDLVRAGLRARAGRVSISDNANEFSGADVLDWVDAVSAELVAAGAEPGDAVLLAVDNAAQDLVGQLAIWSAGCVAVPVHRGHPGPVVAATASRGHASLVVGFTPPEWSSLLSESGTHVYRLRSISEGERPRELDERQALVIFTSGSTGRPKGVVISHAALATKLAAIDEVLSFAAGERMLQVLHLHFSFGQWTSLLTLATAGRLDLVQRFSTDDVLARLAREPYDRIAVVPTMMRMIAARLGDPGHGGVLSGLRSNRSPRLWIAGGEPLAAGLGRQFRTLLPGSAVTDVFGLSESATSDFIVRPEKYDDQAGTIGRPSPGVAFRIVVETSEGLNDAVAGETGELWLHTPHLMTGYLGDEEATSGAVSDGWLRTGDLARPRSDGLVELVGRAKNLIVRGGTKISPLEVENVFSAHPACSGAIAIGVPHPLLGEAIHLVVTRRAGHEPNPAEVREWGRHQIEPAKLPDHVHVVDELPLGVTGKTDRLATAGVVARIMGSAS